jgi:beta-phosphoglucomutase-like phosphatase (HAD superfamily)
MSGSSAGRVGRLIIFDVDGTLVDSRKLIVETQKRVFASHGRRPPVEDRGLSVIGLSLHLALTELAGKDAPIDGNIVNGSHDQGAIPHLNIRSFSLENFR